MIDGSRSLRSTLNRFALTCVVVVVSMEFAVRFDDALRFGDSVWSRVRSTEDLVVRDGTGFHGRPLARYNQFRYNNLGMRGPDADSLKPSGVFRVITVGASETHGLYESEGMEFPRQLEDTLREIWSTNECIRGRTATERVEVLNAAIVGMTMPKAIQSLRLRMRYFDPDVVVYYPTPAQYLYEELPSARAPDSLAGDPPLPVSNALRPRLPGRFRDQLKGLLPAVVLDWLRQRDIDRVRASHPSEWRFPDVPLERVEAFERDLRSLVAAIDSVGAEPVLVTHANAFVGQSSPDRGALRAWERFYPKATGEMIIRFDALANESVREVAWGGGITLADAEVVFGGVDTDVFADFSHFTDVGAGIQAHLIGRAIAESACR